MLLLCAVSGLDSTDSSSDAVANEGNDMPTSLSEEQWRFLQDKGWAERAGNEVAVWVSVDEQILRVVQGRTVLFEKPCATAEKGTGNETNSLQTPLGWHSVCDKYGEGAPWGQVFRSRSRTGEVWKPGDDTDEDLVLSRILALTGEEPGVNKGGRVDSRTRNIYMHGTNAEEKIGIPSSHGCIRLRNDDVIEAFEMVPVAAFVLITESEDAE